MLPRLKLSHACTPENSGYTFGSAPATRNTAPWVSVQTMLVHSARHLPRASLPAEGVTLDGAGSSPPRPALPGHHRSYWLMRRTKFLLAALLVAPPQGLCRLLRAPAGRWSFPTLSPQSVCRCLGPYPAALSRCSCPFLPERHRPHLTYERFGAPEGPHDAASTWGCLFEAAAISLCSGSHTC